MNLVERKSSADKLGTRGGHTPELIEASVGWKPEGLSPSTAIRRVERPDDVTGADVVVAFVRASAELPGLIEHLAPWPRRSAGHSSDVTDRVVREVALASGLVDIKVAAIDDNWSGLRFVWRRERRNDRNG